MSIISAKLNHNEIEYLEKIAIENHLYKGDSKKLSVGKAMKELIKWCQMNQVKIGGKQNIDSSEVQRMLEQIHTIIPHLLYLQRMQILFQSDSISDEKIASCKQQSIDFINAHCGAFQDIQYQTISTVENETGMGKLPIDKNKSKWKITKI
ncbi:TPA: hypothetical protein ACVUIO_002803 [Legionella pneumophila]